MHNDGLHTVHHDWKPALAIAAVTLAVFSPTLASGFVYDARLQILTGDFVHDPRNWWHVLTFRTLAMDILDFNRPVNLASLMLDAAVWGRESFGYHLTSVLIHAANAVLVWSVLRRLAPTLSPVASVAGPVLFAVHPLVTEAVCEPTFREDLLVAFFALAGLRLAMDRPPAGDGRDGWRAAGCVACSLLAIGSKESGIVAPVVIGVYRLLVRRGERGWFWPAVIGGAKAVVLLFLGARFLLEPTDSQIFESKPQYPGGSLAAAMLIEPRILALYAQMILLPVNLCADYGLFSVSHLPLPISLLVIVVIAGAGILAIRADRRMAVAVTLVVVPLLPVMNLFPIYRAAADRYLYVPLAGLGLVVGLLLDAPWLANRPRLKERLAIGAAAAVILLAIGCTERQRVWANSLALWADASRKNPEAFTPASGLAEALRDAGRLPEAEQAARRAIQLSNGTRGDAWATLALILDDQGRTAAAFDALDKAVEVDPRLADPDARVAVLALERPFADDLKHLQAKRRSAP